MASQNLYKDLAVQFGHISKDDPNAVSRFFDSDIYTLPTETRHQILSILLSNISDLSDPKTFPELPEDDYVPLPKPENYVRADEKYKSRRRTKIATLDDSTKVPLSAPAVHNAICRTHFMSHAFYRLANLIYRIERRLFCSKRNN